MELNLIWPKNQLIQKNLMLLVIQHSLLLQIQLYHLANPFDELCVFYKINSQIYF